VDVVSNSPHTEDLSKRKCWFSLFIIHLHCSSCGWQYSFYTSKKIKNYYEVNRRNVYGMRAIGKGENQQRNFAA
jgi:hypothetical protein